MPGLRLRFRARGLEVVGAVFGPGCDGELTPAEVAERTAELAAHGGWLGTWGITPAAREQLAAAARVVPTEASAQALRCAAGETGATTIRRGTRTVELTPFGAMTVYFDPGVAARYVSHLASAVAGATDLEEANRVLAELGLRTELDFERERAGRSDPHPA